MTQVGNLAHAFRGVSMQVTPLNEQSSHEVLYNNSVIHSNEVDNHVSFKLHHLFCDLLLTNMAWNKLELFISCIPSYATLKLHSPFHHELKEHCEWFMLFNTSKLHKISWL